MAHTFKCAACHDTVFCGINCKLDEADHDLCDSCYDELNAPSTQEITELFTEMAAD